jgi:hypothetical protein
VAGRPDSFEGTRDNDGARLANRLADFGISQGTCLQLLLEWNDTKVHPPLDEADIERLSGVPWRSRQSPIGRDNPLLGLEPVPAPPPAPPRLVFPSDVSLDAIRERKEGALVEDLCHRGELAVIYGDSTAGKSFVALDLAYSIARGEPWHGRKVKQGPVLYVCLEGAGGFKLRMAACEVAKGKAGRNLAMLPGGLVLSRGNLGEAGLSEIFAAVAALQEGAGQPVAAVVIDTLQRAMAGDDENSTSDMAAMVGRIGKIQSETGAAVFLCHHTNAAGNMRGSTALFASADAVLKVSKASGKKRRVYVDKAKDFEDGFDLFWFDLASVEIGEDSAGAKYTAAVVCRVDAGKAQEAAKLMKPEKQHIRIFREAASVCASRKGAVDNGMARVTTSDMQAEFFKRYPTGDTDNKMKRDSLLRYWRLTKRDLPAPYELVKDGEADVFQWPCPDF